MPEPDFTPRADEHDAVCGRPSYVWGFGQERRFQLMVQHWPSRPEPALDVGCGIGVYLERFRQESWASFGVDLDWQSLSEATAQGRPVAASVAERLPFPDNTFGVVLLQEVIEHFADDAQALAEAVRVLRPGGRAYIFAPNRLYPFETHGVYWRGRYHFGTIPLVGYLPNALRDKLAPHVRAYTRNDLRRLVAPLPCRVISHVQIYPGYDKISRRWPWAACAVRALTYLLEHTPLQAFGLSHFLVVEKHS